MILLGLFDVRRKLTCALLVDVINKLQTAAAEATCGSYSNGFVIASLFTSPRGRHRHY